MTTLTHFHNPTKVEACVGGGFAYLNIEDGNGNAVSLFMPPEKARAMADAFNAKQPASFATSA